MNNTIVYKNLSFWSDCLNINAEYCEIYGNNCIIRGNYNSIFGSDSYINGDSNQIHGSYCTVVGKNNKILGNKCVKKELNHHVCNDFCFTKFISNNTTDVPDETVVPIEIPSNEKFMNLFDEKNMRFFLGDKDIFSLFDEEILQMLSPEHI
jgi:hypothetical protein